MNEDLLLVADGVMGCLNKKKWFERYREGWEWCFFGRKRQ